MLREPEPNSDTRTYVRRQSYSYGVTESTHICSLAARLSASGVSDKDGDDMSMDVI